MHNRINKITLLPFALLAFGSYTILGALLFFSSCYGTKMVYNYLAHRKNDHSNTTNAAQEK